MNLVVREFVLKIFSIATALGKLSPALCFTTAHGSAM
jgi:hypothetical protein